MGSCQSTRTRRLGSITQALIIVLLAAPLGACDREVGDNLARSTARALLEENLATTQKDFAYSAYSSCPLALVDFSLAASVGLTIGESIEVTGVTGEGPEQSAIFTVPISLDLPEGTNTYGMPTFEGTAAEGTGNFTKYDDGWRLMGVEFTNCW